MNDCVRAALIHSPAADRQAHRQALAMLVQALTGQMKNVTLTARAAAEMTVPLIRMTAHLIRCIPADCIPGGRDVDFVFGIHPGTRPVVVKACRTVLGAVEQIANGQPIPTLHETETDIGLIYGAAGHICERVLILLCGDRGKATEAARAALTELGGT